MSCFSYGAKIRKDLVWLTIFLELEQKTPSALGLALSPGFTVHAAPLASGLTSLYWPPEPIHSGSDPTARPCWEVGLYSSWPFPEALKNGLWGQWQAESALKTQARSKLLVLPDTSHSKDLRWSGNPSRVLSVCVGQNRTPDPY